MKNKYAIILSYVFIIICSVFLMNFQTATVNQLHLGQNFEGDGFVDEGGNHKDPLDIGPSNEEFHRMVLKYAPYAGIGIVVILVLVIFKQRTKLRTFEKPGLIRIENENAMVESDISQLIPHYDKDKFIDARYNDFVEIKRAYLTNNTFKLKKKLTDQLYNQYIQEIEGFKARGEVHTLKDSRYRGAIIKNIEQINTMLVLTLELKVCYFEYVEQNNKYIKNDDIKWLKKLKNNNLIVLDNKIYIENNITFLGFNPDYKYYKDKGNNPNKAITKINDLLNNAKSNYNILLLHTPLLITRNENYKNIKQLDKIDLILCGHTHGGMMPSFFPGNFGIISPERKLFPKKVRGKIKIKKTTMIISSGIIKLSRKSKITFLNDIYSSNINLINIIDKF